MIQSPLNYTGGKYRLLPQLLPLFPAKINTFVDLFCGGCNVGINVDANCHIYNDNCKELIDLYTVMKRYDSEAFITQIESVIREYGLSDVKTKGYAFYGCESGSGLSAYNRDGYMKLRSHINSLSEQDDAYYIGLYVLIIYAFNNQIRFNKKGEFNLPPGKRDFNRKMKDKLTVFLRCLHEQKSVFTSREFMEMDLSGLTQEDFVYADPPYLITCASYNEQGGWTKQDENRLLLLLDELNTRNIKFALSNVVESKGKKNDILLGWINERNYKMIKLNYTYKNANYQRQNREAETKEVLIINY